MAVFQCHQVLKKEEAWWWSGGHCEWGQEIWAREILNLSQCHVILHFTIILTKYTRVMDS